MKECKHYELVLLAYGQEDIAPTLVFKVSPCSSSLEQGEKYVVINVEGLIMNEALDVEEIGDDLSEVIAYLKDWGYASYARVSPRWEPI